MRKPTPINEDQTAQIKALVRTIARSTHRQLTDLDVRYVLCFAQRDGAVGMTSNLDGSMATDLMEHVIKHSSPDGDIPINSILD